MNATDYARWNGRELSGFWFLANFLREEVVEQEKVIKAVMDALTTQYDCWRENTKKGHFGPKFRLMVTDQRAEEVRIVMEHPNESTEVGHLDLAVSNGQITILCEEVA